MKNHRFIEQLGQALAAGVVYLERVNRNVNELFQAKSRLADEMEAANDARIDALLADAEEWTSERVAYWARRWTGAPFGSAERADIGNQIRLLPDAMRERVRDAVRRERQERTGDVL